MKQRIRLGLCLLFGLASCLTEDDDLTLDDQANEAAMRTDSSGVGEYEVEPWGPCSPTITAINHTSIERGYHRLWGNPYFPFSPKILITGQYHLGSTVTMPDAGSDISFTAHVDSSTNTTVTMTVPPSTPLGLQRITLRNACGDSNDGEIWIDPVRAPSYLQAGHGPYWGMVSVSWSNPSFVATSTRIVRRRVGWGPERAWTFPVSTTHFIDDTGTLHDTFYVYEATNYSPTDVSETETGGYRSPP